jgi:hypothetical protein
VVHAGVLNMPMEKLEELAGLLHPIASDFSALVSKIVRQTLL